MNGHLTELFHVGLIHKPGAHDDDDDYDERCSHNMPEDLEVPASVWGRHVYNAFATHQPLLAHYARKAPALGDIWELGSGRGSTPLLRSLVEQSPNLRRLVTVEDDSAWIAKMRKEFPPTDRHRYIQLHKTFSDDDTGDTTGGHEVQHWQAFFDSLDIPKTTASASGHQKIALVFVDQRPAPARHRGDS